MAQKSKLLNKLLFVICFFIAGFTTFYLREASKSFEECENLKRKIDLDRFVRLFGKSSKRVERGENVYLYYFITPFTISAVVAEYSLQEKLITKIKCKEEETFRELE